MLIADHINLLGDNPLIGPNDDAARAALSRHVGAVRRARCATLARDGGAASSASRCARACTSRSPGPNLETRAEYRMLRTLGADVVGMSTVPEVIVAVHAGMRVLGLSIITDMCLPDALEPATVEQIIAVANARGADAHARSCAACWSGCDRAEHRRALSRCCPPDRRADDVERELLARWDGGGSRSRRRSSARDGAPTFVFFEGPPTANGRPGIHHVFARTIKDLFCRHRAMKGFHVARKAGWDTHGLPVEIEVEKQLGISGKQQIEALGVAEFNRLCRESVFKYRGEWEQLSARIGYWLDYEHPYVTYTNDYVESVWWALKTLYDTKLLVPRPQDPAVLPALRHRAVEPRGRAGLPGRRGSERLRRARARRRDGRRPRIDRSRAILVWTTTPWTLVSNIALAVHPDLEYVELVRREDGRGSANAHPRRVARARRARRRLRRIAGRSCGG